MAPLGVCELVASGWKRQRYLSRGLVWVGLEHFSDWTWSSGKYDAGAKADLLLATLLIDNAADIYSVYSVCKVETNY